MYVVFSKAGCVDRGAYRASPCGRRWIACAPAWSAGSPWPP